MAVTGVADRLTSRIEPSRHRAKTKPGWIYIDMPVPHDGEIPNPEKVIELVAKVESDTFRSGRCDLIGSGSRASCAILAQEIGTRPSKRGQQTLFPNWSECA